MIYNLWKNDTILKRYRLKTLLDLFLSRSWFTSSSKNKRQSYLFTSLIENQYRVLRIRTRWEITLRRNFLIEYKYPTILDSCLFFAVKNMITVGWLRYASLSASLHPLANETNRLNYKWFIDVMFVFWLHTKTSNKIYYNIFYIYCTEKLDANHF